MMYNDIKKNKEGDRDEQSDGDASSCDGSYCSADDLCAADLKVIQGGILDVIQQFDKVFNHMSTVPEGPRRKPQKTEKAEKSSKERKPKKKPKEEKPKETP